MTDELQPAISEITEIPDKSILDNAYPLIASVGWATFAGSVLLTSIIYFSGTAGSSVDEFIGGLLFISLFAFLFASIAMLAVGLPVTLILRAIRLETAWLYTVLGAIAGAAILIGLFAEPYPPFASQFAFGAPGALAGLAAGFRWGLWRQRRARLAALEENRPSKKRTNPIHDLIH